MPEADQTPICTPVCLPPSEWVNAAKTAIKINPANAIGVLPQVVGFTPSPEHLAVLTSKYWGAGGVKLTVGFMESTQTDLKNRIISHMNAWGEWCNVEFTLSSTDPKVRISFGNGGYYSYLGTDILSIPRSQQTMNLQGFTMRTPEAEFVRVVRHETGHTLGFPHEHARRSIVSRLDVNKTIAYFQRTQGWSAETVRQQVLTPLEESSLLGTDASDVDSIMCYQLPASITKDGRPIPGGSNFSPADKTFVARLYPKATTPPPPPPPPPPNQNTVTLRLGSGELITVTGKGLAVFNLDVI